MIINKADYHEGMKIILDDQNTYKRVENITVDKIFNSVQKFVKENKVYFTPKEANYLNTFDAKLAYMYGLPKIHKCKKLADLVTDNRNINSNVFQVPFTDLKIPFRPIVSGKRCPLSRMCELAEKIRRPFEKRIPHLIIDSTHFLKKLPKQISYKPKLIAIDIEKLYPSIQN